MICVVILALVLIILIFAPLSCMVLWKKHTYFGDGLAHASVLAGSISAVMPLSMFWSGIIVAIIFSILVFYLKNHSGNNAVINLVSTTMLSIALILNYLYPSQVNITDLLFGDILLVSLQDLLTLAIILIMLFLFIRFYYDHILLIVINRDLAVIHGVPVKIVELSFLVLLSLSVFFTINIVGALMVTGILLLPAMIARFAARTPAQMIIHALIISLSINLLGLLTSYYWDTPITPMIIITGAIIYCLLSAAHHLTPR